MINRQFFLTDGFLHFPINERAEKYYVDFRDEDGALLGEFHIAISTEEPYAYYPIKLHRLAGKTITVSCDCDDAPEAAFDAITVGGSMDERPELYPDIYKEPDRQQIHFSSRRGWLNDPNGLVYINGEYHMCYQHNPFGNRHGGVNVSWGLAVSKDGVHFTEYPDAILPGDSLTHIASGSAVLDLENISGMGEGTVLAAYTALESRMFEDRTSVGTRGQILMYSTDNGHTFTPFPKNPIIPVAHGWPWRDPKILFMDDGSLCIAVYETYEDKNCVSFYSSRDCKTWKFESRTMDLYECPDLFRLPVVETGEQLWVLYGANGMYRIGRFENYRFTQIADSMFLDYGNATYAGQTWNSHPDQKGRYHIAWMSEGNWEEREPLSVHFSQSMSLLCRFTLHKTAAGYRLFRTPIDAVESLRAEIFRTLHDGISTEDGTVCEMPAPGEALFTLDTAASVQVSVNGLGFTYEPVNRKLIFTSGKEYVLTSDGSPSVRIIIDTRSVEFFVSSEISATYILLDPKKELRITGNDGRIAGKIWKLNSIWNKSL